MRLAAICGGDAVTTRRPGHGRQSGPASAAGALQHCLSGSAGMEMARQWSPPRIEMIVDESMPTPLARATPGPDFWHRHTRDDTKALRWDRDDFRPSGGFVVCAVLVMSVLAALYALF